MSMLAAPDTITGPLTVADLDAARKHSTGSVLHLHRAVVMPAGLDQQGRYDTRWPDTVPTDYGSPGWLDSCAPEGGKHADPVPSAAMSMRRHDRIRYRVALVLLLALAGYAAHIAWPLLA